MILILIGLAVLAAYLNGGSSFAVINAVGAVWGLGVMANFRHDQDNVPDYAVWLSAITAVTSLVLIVVAVV